MNNKLDPYQPPVAELEMLRNTNLRDAILFSPTQGTMGTFLGGPLAGIYFIYQNFVSLNLLEEAFKTKLFGSLFILLILAVLPVLPDSSAGMALSSVCIGLTYLIIKNYQLDKVKNIDSTPFTFHSNWMVVAVAVISLLALLILAIGAMYAVELFQAG